MAWITGWCQVSSHQLTRKIFVQGFKTPSCKQLRIASNNGKLLVLRTCFIWKSRCQRVKKFGVLRVKQKLCFCYLACLDMNVLRNVVVCCLGPIVNLCDPQKSPSREPTTPTIGRLCAVARGLDDPVLLDSQRACNTDGWLYLQRRDHHETVPRLGMYRIVGHRWIVRHLCSV